MGQITDTAAETFRDYVTSGVPASGAHEPEKSAIRSLFASIEAAMGALSLGGVDVTKDTRANLNADLAWAADSVALVYADATEANNDLYIKVGGSGSGSWTLTSILHDVIEGLAATHVADAEAAAALAEAAADQVQQSIAAQYGVVLGSGGGAIWDYRYWQTAFFQDAAGTVPVTAAGDPVGCVRNRLGDTSWDRIQADNAKRGTFSLDGGIPHVVCAAGQGLYYRGANKTLSLPIYMLEGVALQSTSANAVVGFINNAGNEFFYFAAETLGRARSISSGNAAGAAQAVARTPNYSVPIGAITVLDALLDVGHLDVRQDGHDELGLSPVTSNFTAGETIVGVAGGINITSESLDLGQVDATKGVKDYGGLILFGGADYDRDALTSMWRGFVQPVWVEGDHTDLALSDSITDDISSSDSEMAEEAFLRLVRDEIAPDHPTDNIWYRTFGRPGDEWTGWRLLQAGTSGANRFFWNASVSGSQPSYMMGERFDRLLLDEIPPERLNRVLWGYGHNMPVSIADASGYLRRGEWMDAMDQVRRYYPAAEHGPIRAHPHRANETILPVVTAEDAVLALYGDANIADVYTPFDTAGRPIGWYLNDNVHLSIPDGVTQQLAVLAATYAGWVSPTRVAPPLLGRIGSSANGLANGSFDAFDGAEPDDWDFIVDSGDGTISRSTAYVDTELGAIQSVRMGQTTGSCRIRQTIDATPYRGSPVTLTVRMLLGPESTSLSTGRLRLSTDGTGAVDSSNWVYETSGKPLGRFREFEHMLPPIPADATQINVDIYCAASGLADVFLSQATLVSGVRPRLAR